MLPRDRDGGDSEEKSERERRQRLLLFYNLSSNSARDIDQSLVDDRDSFTTFLADLLDRDPIGATWRFNELSEYLPREKLITYCLQAADQTPGTAISRYETIAPYLSDEEKLQYLKIAFKNKDFTAYRYLLLNLLSPGWEGFLRDPESKDFVKEALERDLRKEPKSIETVTLLLQSGYLQGEDIVSSMRAIEEKYMPSAVVETIGRELPSYQPYLTSEQSNTLRAKVLQFLEKADTPNVWYTLAAVEGLLSADEIKKYLQLLLEKQPNGFAGGIDIYEKHFGKDALIEQLNKLIESESALSSETWIRERILKDDMPKELGTKYFLYLVTSNPVSALRNLEEFTQVLPEVNKARIIGRLIAKSPTKLVVSSYYSWKEILQLTDEQATRVLVHKIQHDKSPDIVHAFGAFSPAGINNEFSLERFKEMLKERIKNQPEVFLQIDMLANRLPSALRVLWEKESGQYAGMLNEEIREHFLELVEFAAKRAPKDWVRVIPEVQKYYEPEVFAASIRDSFKNLAVAARLLENIDQWGDAIGVEETKSLLLGYTSELAFPILQNISKCFKFLPSSERPEFIKKLLEANPVAILVLTEKGEGWIAQHIPQELAHREINKDASTSPIPLTMAKFQENLRKSNGKQAQYWAALARGTEMYSALGIVEGAGLSLALKACLRSAVQTPGKEKYYLDIFSCFARLQGLGDVYTQEELQGTPEQLENKLLGKISKILGLEGKEFSKEEGANFFQSMETTAPFLSYVLQYSYSESHVHILREMFTALTEGSWLKWKYYREKGFSGLKEEGLLPLELTSDQYGKWAADDKTTSFEALSLTAQGVASKIREVIMNNAEHLYVQPFVEEYKGAENALTEVGNQQKALGRRLGEIKEQLPQETDSEKKKGLVTEQKALQSQSLFFAILRDVLLLTQLKTEDVATGYLIKDGKKIGSLMSLINQVSQRLSQLKASGFLRGDQLDTVLLGQISGFLEEYSQQSGQSKQMFAVTDSSSPKVMLEVGANPVSSCQHYESGMYNECLLGYTEPNVKVLIIQNEDGTIVARSIFRLLEEEKTKQPALHVEFIYSTSASPTIPLLMYTHAAKKAEALGVALYTSQKAQNEQGLEVEAEEVKGFELKETPEVLGINNISAPAAYVDSAGGPVYQRGYSLAGVQRIELSGSSVKEESAPPNP